MTGCAGRVGDVPAPVAVPGTNLQLGGHQPPTAGREQAISDDGPALAQDNEERQRHAAGQMISDHFQLVV